MKAAQISGYAGQDVLKINDVPKPAAGPGEVLVEVHAAGLNPFDYKVREGIMGDALKFPATLGGDVAGTVAEAGEGVSGFDTGQAVFGQAGAASGQGSYAEFTPVKISQLAAKPESLDFVQAAALPLAATSAYQALVDHMNLRAGQKILIHGAAGGIGSFAIQIAKYLGAYVAATAATEDVDYVKQLGADEAIDYKSRDFSEIIKDYDAVFDTVGGETNTRSYQVLKPGGTLVSMVAEPDPELVEQSGVNYIQQQSRATAERLKAVAELADQGVIKTNIDKTFPLEQAAEALDYLKTGHPRGKVVLKIKD
jgi:NADPH:quinone reductase-like Zn-dependent oxidoreductase